MLYCPVSLFSKTEVMWMPLEQKQDKNSNNTDYIISKFGSSACRVDRACLIAVLPGEILKWHIEAHRVKQVTKSIYNSLY